MKTLLRSVLALCLMLPAAARAADENSIVFGHNMSPTTYTLGRGVMSLGNFMAGVGVTDRLTIGTSPWMYLSYNMYSFVARYGADLDADSRWAAQAAYFKTGEFAPNLYQMEATSLWLTWAKRLTPFYTLDVVGNHMHFFDETMPFSLRREPFNDDPWQVSLTTLQEIHLPAGFGLSAEIGCLGLNYVYPEIFYGASMNWKNSWFLAQIGFSQNITVSGAKTLYTRDQGRFGRNAGQYRDFDMHPEIHLQTFF